MAISSPLLETSINGARGILINVTGSMDIGFEEVEQAASLVQSAVHPDAVTIFGATFDENMDDEIRVTVIATGLDEARKKQEEGDSVTGSAGAKSLFESTVLKMGEENGEKEEPEDDPFNDILKIFER